MKDQSASFQDAARAQLSLLAPFEKRALLWLAQRMPAAINSDHLTLLGLVSLLGAGLSYWYASRSRWALLAVIAFLITNWFGDSLDGTLARVRRRQRPRYGFYVDHVVDMFGTLFLLAGLGLSGYMSPAIAVACLLVYFMLSIEVYLATYTIGTFHLSFWKFSPTELRVLLATGNLFLFAGVTHGNLFGARYLLFDIGGVIGVAGMTAMLLVAVVRHTLHLYRAERVP
jgi:phosphatidylglycerophosphate synthase